MEPVPIRPGGKSGAPDGAEQAVEVLVDGRVERGEPNRR